MRGGGTDKDPPKSPPPLRSEKLSRGRQPADANYHQASSNATAKIQEASEPFQSSRAVAQKKGKKEANLRFSPFIKRCHLSREHISRSHSLNNQGGGSIDQSFLCLPSLLPPRTAGKAVPQLR